MRPRLADKEPRPMSMAYLRSRSATPWARIHLVKAASNTSAVSATVMEWSPLVQGVR